MFKRWRNPKRYASDSDLSRSTINLSRYTLQEEPSSSPPAPQIAVPVGSTMAHSKGGKVLAENGLHFRGSPDENAETFVRRFENVAELEKWNGDEQVRFFILALRGIAETWFLSKREEFVRLARLRAVEEGAEPREGIAALGYDFMKGLFLKRFAVFHRPHQAKHELYRARQRAGESMSLWAARCQELGDEAYPNLSSSDRQETVLYPFIEGIQDERVRTQTLASNPQSFEDAYFTAVSLETSMGISSKAHAVKYEKQLMPIYHSREAYGKGNQRVDTSRSYERHTRDYSNGIRDRPIARNGWTEDGRVICRQCNRIGHYAKECRQRNQPREADAQRYRYTPGTGSTAQYEGSEGKQQWWNATQGQRYSAPRGGHNAHHSQNQRVPPWQTNAIVNTSATVHQTQIEELVSMMREQKLEMTEQKQEITRLRKQFEDPWSLNDGNENKQMNCMLAAAKYLNSRGMHVSKKPETREVAVQSDSDFGQLSNVSTSVSQSRRRRRFRKKRKTIFQNEVENSSSETSIDNLVTRPSRQEWISKNRKSSYARDESASSNYSSAAAGNSGYREPYHFPKLRMHSWFLAIILYGCLFAGCNANSLDKRSFFICKPPRGGVPFARMEMTECPPLYDTPGEAIHGAFRVWTPKPIPSVEVKQCFVRNRTVCTTRNSFGDKISSTENILEIEVSTHSCRAAWRTKRWKGDQIVKMAEGVYSTNISLTEPYSGCATVSNAVLQRGTVGITGNNVAYTSIMASAQCDVDQGYCRSDQSVAFWDPEPKEVNCTFQEETFAYVGQKIQNFVRLYKLPQVLHIIDGPLPSCLPKDAYLTKEGIALRLFTRYDAAATYKEILSGSKLANTAQVVCELHKWQRFVTEILTDLDPTLGMRIAFQRKDVQAIWQGHNLLTSNCRKVEVEEGNVRYDHKIGDTCFYYLPVQVQGAQWFAAPSGELFPNSAEIPCAMAPIEDAFTGPDQLPERMIPEKFRRTLYPLELEYALTDVDDSIHSPLSNLQGRITSLQNPQLHGQKKYRQDMYLAGKPFEHLVQEISNNVFDLSYILLNGTTQLVINLVVVLLALWKLIGLICCCKICKPLTKRIRCRSRRRKRNRRASLLRELSNERASSRNRRVISERVFTIGRMYDPDLPVVIAQVNDYKVTALIDTGATMSVVNVDTLRRIPGLTERPFPISCKALSASGKRMPISHAIDLQIDIGPWTVKHTCSLLKPAPYDLILGTDFLKKAKIKKFEYMVEENIAKFDNVVLPALHTHRRTYSVRAVNNLIVKPHTSLRFGAKTDMRKMTQPVVFEPELNSCERSSILLTPTLSQTSNGTVVIEAINLQISDLVLVKEPASNQGVGNKFRHQWRRLHRIIDIQMPIIKLRSLQDAEHPEKEVHVRNVKLYRGTGPEEESQDSDSEGSVEF